jgi:hypothetical protein
MKSKLAGIIVIMAVIGFLFVACNSDGGGDALDGTTWKGTDGGNVFILTFSSPNFTLTMDGSPFATGTYAISGSSVTLTGTNNNGGTPVNMSGTLSGNTLTFTTGEILTKQ